ncbi:MAG TPA: NAD-glutamate dehydrogenase [Nocardioides sp.]|nr:NAD-glutamate dehydrogenase [Nocardioides sp.]
MRPTTVPTDTTPEMTDTSGWQALPPALRSAASVEDLLREWSLTDSSGELADRSTDDLTAAVASHLAAGLRRPPGQAVVRAVDGPASGAGPMRAAVEIVTDDMPFLVDSVTSVLTGLGSGIHSVAHPRLAARRDDSGALVDLRPATSAEDRDVLESWMRVEVDGPVDQQASEVLVAEITGVLEDVRAAVRDWKSIRAAVLQLAEELDRRSDQARDAATFLRWVADDRFTFIGWLEYDREDASGGPRLVPRPGSALGVLAQERHRRGSAPVPTGDRLLLVTKADAGTTVHRATYPDEVRVRRFDDEGQVVGEARLVGLFTSDAYTESVRRVPVVADKIAEALRRSRHAPGSHSARDLLSVLEHFPLDELLQAEVGEILPTALAVTQLQERRRTRVFLRSDPEGGFVSCLVFLPRDRYTTRVGAEVADLLREALGGRTATSTLRLSESALARLHVVVRPRPGDSLRQPDEAELEAAVAAAVRSWEDELLDAARRQLGEADGPALVRRWVATVPASYRAEVPAHRAVDDLHRAEELLAAVSAGEPAPGPSQPALALREAAAGEPGTWRLILYRHTPATLSEVLPLLTDLGVEVTDERPHVLRRADGQQVWVYDMGLRVPTHLQSTPSRADSEQGRDRFRAAFAAAWAGRADSDALSRLVVAADLTWHQVAVLRALVRYLRQTGLSHSLDYVADILVAEAAITRLLVSLFEVRFDPRRHPDERDVRAVEERTRAALDFVEGLDTDRILRALLSAVSAVLRTNAFRRGSDGDPPPHLSFKLDPAKVAGMPEPRPAYEIWVHSTRVEGVHLRFGEVARGGLRWSDRPEDFRTEVLGLVKAQVVKNAVIVPTGAKGGFVARRLPDPAVDRAAWWAEGVACYRTFISGLLDVTDDLVDQGGRQVVVPPADVVRYDGDDPYLVVAADKGTSTFSDIANAIATERGFWLGDAFASGGSNGYDHKVMGITARGAWESVKRHFRELDVDPQTTDITVVGVGDMSGDVFGNGMLLSEHIQLVAAFDHRHVFLDPDPDPALSLRERARLFSLPRSSWADYDPALLSPGGGVHPRTAKSVPVTPQVAARLGLPAGTTVLSPDDLVRAILLAPVDLFWNGGIGTYVKSSTEQHTEVGDRTNDAVRVDGADLRVRVVGEGGNLGLTQRGRIEAAWHGVKLNTDAVDNSAGVDCSDHEVNIKILLDRLVTDGVLDGEERNRTLRRMTDDVARLVLRDNDEQNRVLSVETVFARENLPAHRRFLEALESSGQLDRGLEALPTTAELDRRARAGAGLTTPELSVLLAYAKISLSAAVLASPLPDEAWARAALRTYFPVELGESYGDRLDEHPLHREIITTVLVNRMIASTGITFAFRAAEETGADAAEVVRAHAVATHVFDLEERRTAVEGMDGRVPADVQARMRHQHQRLLDRAVRWFLHARPEGMDVPHEAARFSPIVRELGERVPDLLLGQDLDYVQDLAGQFTAGGVDAAEAVRTAGLLSVFALLDIAEVAEDTAQPTAEVAATWFLLSQRYGLDSLLTRVSALERTDRWEALARAALRDDLYTVHRELTTAVLGHARVAPRPHARSDVHPTVAQWEGAHATAVGRARQTLTDLDASGRTDLVALSVALRILRTVLRRH